MEKQCQICGGYFETDNTQRLYCDKCAKNPEKYWKQYRTGLAMNKRRMYSPALLTANCCQCGKEFTTIKRLRYYIKPEEDGAEELVFCSSKCKDEYLADHAVCMNCGKPLLGTSYYTPDPDTWFCDEACEKEYRKKEEIRKFEAAKARGDVHTCLHCGKEFVRTGGGKFCSQACYRAALDEGWRPERYEAEPPKFIYRVEACACCGKTGKVKYPYPIPAKRPIRFCSKECKELYIQRKKAEKEQAQKQEALRRQREEAALAKARKQEAKRQEKLREKEENTPLCATCKTSYVDCERMQSEFRVLPKGAKYNMNGVLRVCPKYT